MAGLRALGSPSDSVSDSENAVVKATFHLTISMHGQRATCKIKGIITITGVATLL